MKLPRLAGIAPIALVVALPFLEPAVLASAEQRRVAVTVHIDQGVLFSSHVIVHEMRLPLTRERPGFRVSGRSATYH
jgi:hypothetical protein